MRLSRSDLLALSRKYQVLAELRRAQYQMSRLEVRGPLQKLSAEFPGALRELDSLPLDEIDGRAEQLETAAASGAAEAWMEWLHEYHLVMRAALFVKREACQRRSLSGEDAARIAAASSAESGYPCDPEFVEAVLNPPEGRLNAVVFARLELRFGQSAAVISEALFLRRNSARH